MRTILIALSLLFCAQDKTYDLKLSTPRKAGQKFQLSSSQHMQMKLNVNGQPAPGKEEKRLLEGTEDVVSADAEGAMELRCTFTKAQQFVEGEMKPYAFEGKPLTVKRAKGGTREYTYADGSPVSDEDRKALKDAIEGDERSDASKAFAPVKPVKVGESWEPEIQGLAGMFAKQMAGAVDPAKSKAKFTLVSVEKRDGAEYGRIEGGFELLLGAMGPLKLETPMMLKMDLEMTACVDNSVSAGVMKLKGSMKGESDVEAQGQKIHLDMDMTIVGTKSKVLLK